MYAAFSDMRTVTQTRTNVKMFLDDPDKKDGIFGRYVSVILEGHMEVMTSPQVFTTWDDVGPLHILPWWVGEMPSVGESSIGTIKMEGNPDMTTTGIIRQNVSGQAFPGTLEAAVYQTINVPGYGLLHNKAPVIVSGAVDSIPPFHLEAACRCALLFDSNDQPRGAIGGRSLTLLGPA